MPVDSIVETLRQQRELCRYNRVVAMAEVVDTIGLDALEKEDICLASHIGEPSVPPATIGEQWQQNRD